ncbi:rhodanese-like domain-containing protein [Riemerella anatipestifer]|uniref:rhodanese-like domain-containing protein n=1 Tax=Riemerella anatipestifer TaxID=34085 RepID=UPI00129E41E9|nr:rhodanese-like domain-containing protein [Riemerella anatipestifer]MRN16308.1 rhodanese-like domain-containing protein [Riemerella anatipestifer]
MLNFIKKRFGGNTVDFQDLAAKGAQIIDVRTKAEYNSGHIFNSINIPLQELNQNLNRLDKSRPVITCCASGMRSASAKSILSNNGFTAYNGGGWSSLQKKILK